MIRRISILALGLAASVSACSPQAPNSAATSQPSPSPSESPLLSLKIAGKGNARQPVRWFEERGNRKQYELIAQSYQGAGATGSVRATFHTVQVTFFAKDGTQLYAQAPQALVDQTTNTVDLKGGVHAHNSAGMTLVCDELVYDRATEMVHGNGHVVITDTNGMHATGNRFDSDITLTHTRMQ